MFFFFVTFNQRARVLPVRICIDKLKGMCDDDCRLGLNNDSCMFEFKDCFFFFIVNVVFNLIATNSLDLYTIDAH